MVHFYMASVFDPDFHALRSKDQPTRIKIMAIQSFKTIVSNGTDKEKLSLGKSDAIPLFRRQLSSLTNDMDDDDEKLRGTILSILSEIIWPFSGSHLELVSASYVKAGLIPVLVKFLRFVAEISFNIHNE